MVVILFGTNEIHLENGTTLGTTIVFVRLVQVDPNNIMRFNGETYTSALVSLLSRIMHI